VAARRHISSTGGSEGFRAASARRRQRHLAAARRGASLARHLARHRRRSVTIKGAALAARACGIAHHRA